MVGHQIVVITKDNSNRWLIVYSVFVIFVAMATPSFDQC